MHELTTISRAVREEVLPGVPSSAGHCGRADQPESLVVSCTQVLAFGCLLNSGLCNLSSSLIFFELFVFVGIVPLLVLKFLAGVYILTIPS